MPKTSGSERAANSGEASNTAPITMFSTPSKNEREPPP
jgi:hypothetical protein